VISSAPPIIRAAVREKIVFAARAGDSEKAWDALERAHVLCQSYLSLHLRLHLSMLRRSLRDRDRIETVGQIVRVIVAGPAPWLTCARRT
jgi:Protein of unknown function (DUF3703).